MVDIQRRLQVLENWRSKAFSLASSDRVGNVLVKQTDLMMSVVREGVKAQDLGFLCESLRQERSLLMKYGTTDSNPLRDFIFGMSECLETMIEGIIERDTMESQPVPIEHSNPRYNHNLNETFNALEGPSAINYTSVKSEEPDTTDFLDDLFDVDGNVRYQSDPDQNESSEGYGNDDSDQPPMLERQEEDEDLTAEEYDQPGTSMESPHKHRTLADDLAASMPPPKRFKSQNESSKASTELKSPLKTNLAPKARKTPVYQDRKHKCNLCSFSTDSHSLLVVHMNSHSGVRPHPCSTCSRSFTSSTLLKAHLRTAHGINPYECAKCGEKFGLHGQLIDHQKVHWKSV